MTERRKLKIELSKLRSAARRMPILIDCSNVYGDHYYKQEYLDYMNKRIDELKKAIEEIDRQAKVL